MRLVKELIARKGEKVYTITPHASVLDAASLMNVHHIGSLVVVDEGEVVGIITERDVMTRVVARQRDAAHTSVGEVMTERVVVCASSTTIDELRQVMRERRIRHVPVVDAGELRGMVSIGDVNFAEQEVLTETIRDLEAYIRLA
ncbi:MAG: CBS domain-containing protein [Phycisphaeraceae bacterium]|nr:CBS domain-containing protein [Phycisphaeraceae bacterium]MCW5754986.1 CBS domain-containing protein [Phycisphaeraceae bacterium]